MKIDKPINPNYAAVVVKLKSFVQLPTCDNLVGTPIMGNQAIVSKETKVGEMGIMFAPETQLSDEYCAENNLYRHADQNKNKGEKGYMEDNRRIRAIKFRGNTSNCLFMPLQSLAYTGIDVSVLREGDEFDTINGKEVCRKYVIPGRGNRTQVGQEKKKSRVEQRHMPEHIDTLNFMRSVEKLDMTSNIIVTQKLHGTSIRIGHTIVKRKMSLGSRIAKAIGIQVLESEFSYVYGSRKVIKDAENPDQNHFYDTDIWSREGKKLQGLLPKNYIVYAELVGWTEGGAEIQKDYTYSIPKGETQLFVYRIANVNEDGYVTDLSWEQVKAFCKMSGLDYVPELWKGALIDFKVEDWMDKRYFETNRNALWLGENSFVDEGVCIRIEGINPQIFKAKSPLFLEHETKILDTGEEDLESQQSSDGNQTEEAE